MAGVFAIATSARRPFADLLLCSAAYSRKLDVLNRGFGGYTSEWCLPIFDEIFDARSTQQSDSQVRLVTIWFGANDATLPMRPQHLPLAKYKQNLDHYITSLLSSESPFYQPAASVLLITPPPICQSLIDEVKLQYPPERRWVDRTLDNTRTYKDAVLEVVERARSSPSLKKDRQTGKARVAVADVWKALFDATGGEQPGADAEALRPFFTDGLHMTPEGYAVVFDEVIRVIRSEFAGLDPEDQSSLPLRPPHWDAIDHANPIESVKRGGKRLPRDEL